MKYFPNTLNVISILITSMCEGVLGFQFLLKIISFLASYKQVNFSFTTVISLGKGVQLYFMAHSCLQNSRPRSFLPWFSLTTSALDWNLFYHLSLMLFVKLCSLLTQLGSWVALATYLGRIMLVPWQSS